MIRQKRLASPKVSYSYGAYNVVKGKSQAIRITEGCPNQCPYCYEPAEIKVFGVPEIVKNHVLIYDMNLLCKPKAMEILKELAGKRVNNKPVNYELICGVDFRYLTKEIAIQLKKTRIKKIRLAWDWTFNDQYKIKTAIFMLFKAGYKPTDIMVFMICNWNISYKENLRKMELCKVWGVQISDCYFDNQTFPHVIPAYWTNEQNKNFRKKTRKHNQLVNFKLDPEILSG